MTQKAVLVEVAVIVAPATLAMRAHVEKMVVVLVH
jgi:hypothetical protein